jgi:FAD/FMN-containing dehydrogenase
MSDLRATTIHGTDIGLDKSVIETFQGRLRGVLLNPEAAGYDEARTIHNGMIARRAGAADAMAGVRFAREHELLVSVCGGGHGMPGYAVCEGGLMLDLSLMAGIHVDPGQQTVRADAGVTWGAFDRETQTFGLATTGGAVGQVDRDATA